MKFSPWEVYRFFSISLGWGKIYTVSNSENNNHLHHNITLAEGDD